MEFKVYMATNRDIELIQYKELRNQVNSAIRKDKLDELLTKFNLFKQKKVFYGYIKWKSANSHKSIHQKSR